MNKNILWGIIVAVVAIGGGIWFYSPSPSGTEVNDLGNVLPSQQNQNQTTTTPPVVGQPQETSTQGRNDMSSPTTPSVKEFTVSGKSYSFVPSLMKVKKGDTVRITFVNEEGMHDLVIDEFSVATKRIRGGERETVEFIANKSGTFEFYCSVGSHRALGMKGSFIVE